ncbi:cytochrome-c peroxidase [Cytophaga aurantiaca]|uniref:cytochrome-c peroxidase n=1 Tax=Cytophaga aurantiaca TaxID=29530 RepID=UPI000362ED6A|nr:cytochrome c peroxidase [Cytophaga aurantiaca]
MKKYILSLVLLGTLFVSISFISKTGSNDSSDYQSLYFNRVQEFKQKQKALFQLIDESDLSNEMQIEKIRGAIQQTRVQLKGVDFWMRYLEPISYKKINGPLPVEWETEVFEKHEAPYKREAAGLTLTYLYLEEEQIDKTELKRLIGESVVATNAYLADSITKHIRTYHHFYLCNRLYLLNLAAIYTTGFECPDTEQVLPELLRMLKDVDQLYAAYNKSFPETALNEEYLSLYKRTIEFVFNQSNDINTFDHFTFIQQYINPLYVLNQKMILEYNVSSKSMVDYSLNKNSTSIFDKDLYFAQNPKGIFSRVSDTVALKEINDLGKLLFYDPILSGNNLRSCASCHLPTQYFTDTTVQTALQFDRLNRLPRNTPSLINVRLNHLLMLDGAHITMQNQAKAVLINPIEMGSTEIEALRKVLNCKEYNTRFTKLLKYTPQETQITIDHLTSALTAYYTKFSNSYAPFDEAMIQKKAIDPVVQEGFNLFMSKAQCATCHFVPQFNGVKPPYVNSEFEVIGVPGDKQFAALSADKGRSTIYTSDEMHHAFRTGSIRNATYTKPYMHNGVFNNLTEVIEFYNNGGGVGRGLTVPNQTLSSDSLHLTPLEIKKIVVFIESLNENITFEKPPLQLPVSKDKMLLQRKVGGVY